MVKNIVYPLLLSLAFWGCAKDDFQWNLDKVSRLPTVNTIKSNNVYNNGATISGEIVRDGGSSVTQRGVCWSTSQNPTTADNTTNNGTGIGPFTSTLTNLNVSTTYYVRAYAINEVGTAYGNQISLTTTNISAALPTLTTSIASSISMTSCTTGGTVTSDGGSAVTQRGICWSTNQNPTITDNVTNDGTGIGSFTSSLTNLTASTTYYIRAYAINGVGTAYGNQISFTTSNISMTLPTLTTVSASAISVNSSISGGTVTSDGGSAVTQRGVCWGTNQNPTMADNITNDGTGIGSFTSSLTNLSANTTYYTRAYAINGVGTAYGNQKIFTTPSPVAVSVGNNTCASLNGITSSYHGMNGTSAPWGLSGVGYSGTCWVAPDPNNSGQLGTVVGANHYVQFNRNFLNQGYIEFWVNTSNPGYNNLIPNIEVNGSATGNATMIGGQQSSFYWMKVRSPILPAGNNTIKILLSGSYYVLKIDEIEFFEY
jgi:hypothetical protein